MEQKLTMKKGITDALPIFLGYFSVSIAFGVLAVQKGIPLWAPLVMSLTDFSGTGQFAALDLLSSLAAFAEIACAILIINARYFLMSVSLSQKLLPDIKQWQRYIIAFGNTDEVYAVATGQTLPLAVIKSKITNRFLQSFLLYMPYGVLSAMIFPAILYSTSSMISAAIATAVALVLSYRKKGLLTVAICAVLVVLVTEYFFI